MQITSNQFDAMFNKSNDRLREKYFPYVQDVLDKFQINVPYRIAAFFAQVAVESQNLLYCEECASGDAYTNRKDLGNIDATAISVAAAAGLSTGVFYKGRGLIQITGYYNLNKCGEALGLDLVHNPNLLLTPENAWRSAAWFWNTHNCNALADVGMFGSITKVINGGSNAAQERLDNYINNKKVLGVK